MYLPIATATYKRSRGIEEYNLELCFKRSEYKSRKQLDTVSSYFDTIPVFRYPHLEQRHVFVTLIFRCKLFHHKKILVPIPIRPNCK